MTAPHDFDLSVAEWLREGAAPAPPGLLESVLADVARSQPRPGWWARLLVTWDGAAQRAPSATAVLIALLLLALAVGAALSTGGRPVGEPILQEGFRLVASDAAGISIQVPERWTREMRASDVDPLSIGAAMGNGGVLVERLPDAGGFDATVGAYVAAQEAAGAPTVRRRDGRHGRTYRAARVTQTTSVGGQELYFVEVSPATYLVTVAWDTAPIPASTLDAILGSFNPGGPGPMLYEPVR